MSLAAGALRLQEHRERGGWAAWEEEGRGGGGIQDEGLIVCNYRVTEVLIC